MNETPVRPATLNYRFRKVAGVEMDLVIPVDTKGELEYVIRAFQVYGHLLAVAKAADQIEPSDDTEELGLDTAIDALNAAFPSWREFTP